MKKLNKDLAVRFLSDVPSDKVFYVDDGRVLKNMHELRECLTNIKEHRFMHHVNEEKNDFRNWVMDVIEDKDLAKKIEKANKADKMLQKIENRIKTLQEAIGKKE